MEKTCTDCVVSAGTHKPAEALHQQIAEPKSEALRLADMYDYGDPAAHGNAWKSAVCTELRAQNARIAELEGQLEAIGTGGVEPLRKPAAAQQAVPGVRLTGMGPDGGFLIAPAHPAEGVPAPAAVAVADERAAFSATQPAAQGMEKDAARWRMAVLISRETMTHPDKRTAADAVAAYMHAVHSGLDIEGAVDAALAAQAKQGG